MRLIVLCCALLALMLSAPAFAQSDVEKRAQTLEEITQKLNDPDPMTRLAAMESYLQSGDTLIVTLAVSVAMQSDDAMLRSLAMRGFMMTQSQIDFDIKYPGKMESQYQKVVDDPDKVAALMNDVFFKMSGNNYIASNIHAGGRVVSIAFELDDDGLSGKAYTLRNTNKDNNYSGEIRVNGDLILFETPNTAVGSQSLDSCKFKLMPPEKGMLVGEMKCSILSYPISAEVR